MKILFLEWDSFAKEDIKQAITQMGHSVIPFQHKDYDLRTSPDFQTYFDTIYNKHQAHCVFSSNYFPLLSAACAKYNIPYIAWVYDCPHINLYSASLINKCNHVFLFDSETYLEFHQAGISTVYYLPLSAPCERYDTMIPNSEIHKKLDADISFVGSLYDEKHTLFDKFNSVSPYTKGYLDALIQSQLLISGYNFTESLLKGKILEELRSVSPYTPNFDGVETDTYVYSRYFLDRKITEIERKQLLTAVSEKFNLNLYTHQATPYIPKAHNLGAVNYIREMPYVFKCSKINLNITLRSIHQGIPLRAMDIMGAGGFLLTNFQSDFMEFFEPNIDYVYFENTEDLLNKCDYYLTHPEERKAIAENGYHKIKAYHTYEIRLKTIFDSIFKVDL